MNSSSSDSLNKPKKDDPYESLTRSNSLPKFNCNSINSVNYQKCIQTNPPLIYYGFDDNYGSGKVASKTDITLDSLFPNDFYEDDQSDPNEFKGYIDDSTICNSTYEEKSILEVNGSSITLDSRSQNKLSIKSNSIDHNSNEYIGISVQNKSPSISTLQDDLSLKSITGHKIDSEEPNELKTIEDQINKI